MTESPDFTTESIGGTYRPDTDQRDRRLLRALAWVGIIAGVLFIVAVIFFSGLAVGRGFGGYHGWHRGYQGGQMAPGGCPMMGPGGKMGGGMMGPGGMDPDEMGPGMMRPGQPPVSTGPAPNR